MIDLDKLEPGEKRAIEELRMRMGPLEPHVLEGLALYKFLKARDFDVNKAERMLRKHIIWKKANQVNTILENLKEKEYYTLYLKPTSIGYDKEGDLVAYLPMGKIDPKDIFRCATMNDFLKQLLRYIEETKAIIIRRISEDGKRLPQLTCIIDLDKLTLGNATSKLSAELCLRMLHIIQDNYPEGVKSFYLINAPSYYVFMFSVLKVIMSRAMLRKISIFSNNGWKEKLLEVIDADALPAFLGGNRTDPDGNFLCKTFVCHGGRIPPCYYLSDEDRYFKDKCGVINVLIPTFGKQEIYVDVTEAGSLIQWEFLVKNKDIGFALLYKKGEILTEVLPIQRYDTLDGTEVGAYRTKSAGKYILVFDNSYSWMNSKEMEYCVKVVKIMT